MITWLLLLAAIYTLGAAAVLHAAYTAPRQQRDDRPTPWPRLQRAAFPGWTRTVGALYGHRVEREPLVLVFTRTQGWAA